MVRTPPPPLKNYKSIGFLSNTGPDPLKITKLPSQHGWGAQWLSGRVLDLRPKGRGFEAHRRHCVVSLSKNINPSLVLVQPTKAHPYITERLLMGRKESNQTKQKQALEIMENLENHQKKVPCMKKSWNLKKPE